MLWFRSLEGLDDILHGKLLINSKNEILPANPEFIKNVEAELIRGKI